MDQVIDTVGVLIFDKEFESVLLVKHLSKAEHASEKFGIPAGRLENGQNLIENAIRELKEETGLDTTIEYLKKLPFVYEADIPRKDGTIKHFRLETFFCNRYVGELKGNEENEPVWVEISELSNLDLLPNMQKVVQDTLDYIVESSQQPPR